MKKFIVKFATVILYVLMVAYLSEFKIGLLLDWKALAAVFSGSLLFSVPAVFNTDSRSSWRNTFCKNIITAGYIATFLFLFARLNQPKGYENLLADIALNCRPLLYSLILYILLKPEKPAEEDEPVGDVTEESESIREDCQYIENSVLVLKTYRAFWKLATKVFFFVFIKKKCRKKF